MMEEEDQEGSSGKWTEEDGDWGSKVRKNRSLKSHRSDRIRNEIERLKGS
jgi:hypothetical protein